MNMRLSDIVNLYNEISDKIVIEKARYDLYLIQAKYETNEEKAKDLLVKRNIQETYLLKLSNFYTSLAERIATESMYLQKDYMKVFELYYIHKKPIKEIASTTHYSYDRVRHIIQKIDADIKKENES